MAVISPPNGALPLSVVTLFKTEIARALAELKHPAPAVANTSTAVVRSAAGSWTQNVAPYLGTGVTFVVPSVVVLAGWPEYGSVLPPQEDGGGYDRCNVRGTSMDHFPPAQCVAPEVELRSWVTCASGNVGDFISVPEAGVGLTFGWRNVAFGVERVSAAELADCQAACGTSGSCKTLCANQANNLNGVPPHSEYMEVILNNTAVRSVRCKHYDFCTADVAQPGRYICPTDLWSQGVTDKLCCWDE